MLHRHLNHSEWTLPAIDDVIARGRRDDWKQLRDAATGRAEIRQKIIRVSKHSVSGRLNHFYKQVSPSCWIATQVHHGSYENLIIADLVDHGQKESDEFDSVLFVRITDARR